MIIINYPPFSTLFYGADRRGESPPVGRTHSRRNCQGPKGKPLTDGRRHTTLYQEVPHTWAKLAWDLNSDTPYVYYSNQAMHMRLNPAVPSKGFWWAGRDSPPDLSDSSRMLSPYIVYYI
jgi:hypothetical protein